MRSRPVLPLAVLAFLLPLALSGCAHPTPAGQQPVAPILTGDPAHPGLTQGWLETDLYFGLGPADHPEQGISEAKWRAFLDREVTPRFPDGLSVIDIYGQWQGKGEAEPSRLHSKLLIVAHAGTPENNAKIEAIRTAWKRTTGDQSVLRISKPADVSF